MFIPVMRIEEYGTSGTVLMPRSYVVLLLLVSALSWGSSAPAWPASPAKSPSRRIRMTISNDLWLAGLKNGCASGLATICCKTALQPFDTLKTLQQMSTARINLIETSSRLVRDHGILALYRGLGVSLVGAVPAM